MKPLVRRLPWILAAILGGYSLVCLLLLGIFNAWDIALPPWAESVYLAVFIAPVLILCWPWLSPAVSMGDDGGGVVPSSLPDRDSPGDRNLHSGIAGCRVAHEP